MAKQNITLSLDKALIRRARQLSVRKSMSVSKLLSVELERLVQDREQYDMAKRRALSALKKGYHMGGRKPSTRDDLHDRKGLR